jgi:hypothetical protein
MQNVRPGYRAIVAWVKNRMVQEIYAQIRNQAIAGIIAQNATLPAAENATSATDGAAGGMV